MTYISIISTDIQVMQTLKQKIKDSIHSVGVISHLESELYQFIELHPDKKHLVFVKPVDGTMYRLCPTKLKTKAPVDLIMIVNHLPKEFLPFILKCLCIGIITPDDTVAIQLNELVANIQSNGRLVNHLVTEHDWNNVPPYVRPRPMPHLTSRESEVLILLCHGHDGKKIAHTIHTSVSNIRNIVASLKAKLNCQSEKEIMIVALANLWVEFDPTFIHSLTPKAIPQFTF